MKYVNYLFARIFILAINKPTRITELSAKLIHNIITNADLSRCILSIVCTKSTDLSNHLPVVLQTRYTYHYLLSESYVLKRTFSDATKSKFVGMIKTKNWVTSLKLEETQTRMSFLTTSVLDLIVYLKIVFH